MTSPPHPAILGRAPHPTIAPLAARPLLMAAGPVSPDRLALIDEHDYYRAMTAGSLAERAFHPRRVAMLRRAVGLEGKAVLDLGCSTGPLSVPLLESGVDVVSVDLSAAHLRALQDYARSRGATARTVQADGADLPFDDDAFDVVFVASVAHLVHDPGPLLREAERVCRLDGRIVVAGPWSKHPKANPAIKTLLRGGKAPDGRSHPFDLPRLRRWLPRSRLVKRRTDWLLGYLVTVWTPENKPR